MPNMIKVNLPLVSVCFTLSQAGCWLQQLGVAAHLTLLTSHKDSEKCSRQHSHTPADTHYKDLYTHIEELGTVDCWENPSWFSKGVPLKICYLNVGSNICGLYNAYVSKTANRTSNSCKLCIQPYFGDNMTLKHTKYMKDREIDYVALKFFCGCFDVWNCQETASPLKSTITTVNPRGLQLLPFATCKIQTFQSHT